MKGLQDKVAIITGGATLIGAGVARAFVAAGASVAILDIDVVGGERVAAELGEKAIFIATDITKDDQVSAAVAKVVSRFGGVDFLVNLACTYLDDGFKSPRADWQTALDVNVVSGIMLAQKVHPEMKARGGRCNCQLYEYLGKGCPDGALALSGFQGGNFAADAQYGDGPRARPHSCERGVPGLDLVQVDGRNERWQSSGYRRTRHTVPSVGTGW